MSLIELRLMPSFWVTSKDVGRTWTFDIELFKGVERVLMVRLLTVW